MANSSNPPDGSPIIQDLAYLYASNTNVSNFVSVKLSGNQNYKLWKKQMVCLMNTHDMCHLVDDNIPTSSKIMDKYDHLLQGWIVGSLSEDALRLVLNDDSAQEIWKKLKKCYDSDMSSEQGHADSHSTKGDIETGIEDTKVPLLGSATTDKAYPTDDGKNDQADNLPQLMKDGNWNKVYEILEKENKLKQKIIKNDGNTLLHIAVGKSLSSICSKIIEKLDKHDLTQLINSEDNTALHIAAIVGNTDAAKLLVEKNNSLLVIINKDKKTPLDCACEFMHLDTIKTLMDAFDNLKKDNINAPDGDQLRSPNLSEKSFEIVANAFSAQRYEFAYDLIKKNPEYALKNKKLMMAMAKTFPADEEALIFSSLESITNHLIMACVLLFLTTVMFFSHEKDIMKKILCCEENFPRAVLKVVLNIFLVPLFMVYWVIHFLYAILVFLLFLLWKAAAESVGYIIYKHKKKTKDIKVAKEFLEKVCEINPDNVPVLYTKPILEAARQDAFEVVQEILWKWPEAIACKDNNGYDIIQLATMHRSHRVYNLVLYKLVYTIGERKSIYRTKKDVFGNNMLHLAGRLAPPNKLKRGTGAALQLQRELQWRQEVEKLVFPAYITKENIYEETPEMVFTKEHKDLVVQGEQWMKTVAESCSVTAALIITIVFAAAITVPGGNQENGIPIFREDVAFLIFLITDAISLFSSTTALLVFLSILTARFAEEDFLVSLPRRLIIGLCMLLFSTAAMMIAFGATLFLVSSDHTKKWLLAIICVTSLIPIGFFFFLQFPLIIDLWRSTFKFKFGMSEIKSAKLNPKLALLIGK